MQHFKCILSLEYAMLLNAFFLFHFFQDIPSYSFIVPIW